MESMRSTLHLERTTAKNDPRRLCGYLFWYDLDTLVRPNIPRNGRLITPLVLKDLDTFIGHTVRQEGRFAAGVVEKTEQLINMWIGFGRILNTLATQLDISILLKLPVRAAEHL